MVAQILRLKLIVLANSFRRTPWQVVGLVLALLYGIGTSIFVSAGLIALRYVDVELARPIVIVFGALSLIVFALLPLVLGIDDILDPRRFSLFGLSNTTLATGIGLASLFSVPAMVITVIAIAQMVTWGAAPGGVALSLTAAVLIVVTCVISARISTTLASFLLSSRRSRDLTVFAAIVLVIAASPVIVWLTSIDWATDGLVVLTRIANVASWTPLGAAWAAPADAAAGLEASSLAKLAIAIIWVLLLFVLWKVLLGAVLVTPERRAQAKKFIGLGWFDRLPRTPIGAIAARSLTYWTRDARYLTSLIAIPVIPLFMVVVFVIAGVPVNVIALLPVPVMCLFLSWSVHNDVSFDNSAIWLHLASSTSGWDDRWGRLLPALGFGVPLVAVGSIVSAAIYGDWVVLPSLIGVSAAILFVGLGLSSIMSARFAYPAVRPGDSPFSQPQAGGNAAGLIQGLSFFGILVFASPAIAAAILGFLVDPLWHIVALVSGVGIGVAALIGGVRVGASIYDDRSADLLAAALKN